MGNSYDRLLRYDVNDPSKLLPDLANFKNSGWGVLNAIADFTTHLGNCQRLGTMDTQVRKNRELNESNPLLEQGLVLVRALAN